MSVIVLCRNEQKYIGPCLDSLLATQYDHRLLEIIVVDGMSTDRTRQIVAEYCRQHPVIRMVDNPKRIIPAGLNVGLREAKADIIVRIDAHAVYPPEYISRLVQGLERWDADAFGGLLAVHEGQSAWERAMALIWSHPFGKGDSVHRVPAGSCQPQPAAAVYPGCWRRRVFQKIGPFNELLVRAEDREFYARLARAGARVFVDPTLRMTYFPRSGLWAYARYCAINGFWIFYAHRFALVRLVALRNFVPMLFVAWHLVALGLAWALPPWGFWAAAPIGAYWLAAAAASAHAARKHRDVRLFPCMVVLFALTHYPYGAGSLWGLLLATLRGKKLPAVDRPPAPASAPQTPAARPALGRRPSLVDECLKRAFDVTLALIGLVLSLPLLAVIALAIKLDSPGPVFYRGVRIGRFGRPFRLFKFRSMVVGAEKMGGSTASSNDPRVTRVGRLLRKYKLDELPNLINVLVGNMSIVGPRPEVAFYTDKYTEEERLILSVRPGITDFASVEFSNQQELIGDEDPEGDFQARVLPRKNALRLKYVRERSFWVDLRILLATVWLVVSRPFRRKG
ncbi:MAG: sugar transferase [Thermoguttaceae bacterium]